MNPGVARPAAVLLVDDGPSITVTLGVDLAGSGCRVTHAADGAVAIETLAAARYSTTTAVPLAATISIAPITS